MNILDKIIEVKKEEVKVLRKEFNLSRFSDRAFFNQETLDFKSNLSLKNKLNVIAEVKKASPSKGIIRNDFNHLKIAEAYMNNNVAAVSVLTDKYFFQGSINFLNEIAKFKNVPLMRKDFLIDEYQIFEAKANGADAILLICEALSKNQIAELSHAAFEHNMQVLLELHSIDQIDKINFNLNQIIGVNNRDLKTFEVDIKTTEQVKKLIPDQTILVSESGISKNDDIHYLKSINVNAVLIGEHFMRQDNVSEAVNIFIEQTYES